MPDVFIPYSRRDQPFVRRLHDRLAKDSRDVWVDWEDIPPTAKWWSEIGVQARAVRFDDVRPGR